MKTIKNIIPFARELVSVTSSANIEEIQTLMLSKGVSMIPIIDHHNTRNTALVRRKNIWKWFVTKGKMPLLKDIRENKLPELLVSDPFELAMKILKDNSAILIRGEEGKFEKILTPKGTAESLNCYAERFILIEDLEKDIRKIFSKISKSKILKVLNKNSNNNLYQDANTIKDLLEMLYFNDYRIIFSELWEDIGLNHLDKKLLIKMLLEVIEVRNETMHFRFSESNDISPNKIKEFKKILS